MFEMQDGCLDLEREWGDDMLNMDFSSDPLSNDSNMLSFAQQGESFVSDAQVLTANPGMEDDDDSTSGGEEYHPHDVKMDIQPSISSLRQKCSTDASQATTKPQSGRAKSIAANAAVYDRFAKLLPFLTQRPPLKNENGLFDDLQYLIDECIMHFNNCQMLNSVGIICTMMPWAQMLRIASNQRFLWTRMKYTMSQSHEPEVYDVYIDRNHAHVWIVTFVHWKQEFDVSANASDAAELLRNLLEIPSCVPVEFLQLPLLSGGEESVPKTTKKKMRFAKRKMRKVQAPLVAFVPKTSAKTSRDHAVSMACECKVWSLLLLFFVNGKSLSPDRCYLETFLSEPERCLVLMNLSIQSLLYYCAEHDQLLESWHTRVDKTNNHVPPLSRSVMTNTNVADKRVRGSSVSCDVLDMSTITSEHCRQVSSKLFGQTNRKSLLAMRKQSSNRVGKFKGRQRDNLLCITINGTVGVQITFEDLFTTSIFAHLIEAQKLPCDTGINYSDLVNYLPFVFPQSFECRFGAEFYIKTPYMQTSDPECMFGPIANMLWPDVPNIDTLVKQHLKTYKLEFEIAATHENTVHSVQFVCALELGPNKPYVDWKQWVSVVDTAEQPLGIYYRGDRNLRTACLESNKHQMFKQHPTTQSQFKYISSSTSLLHHIMLYPRGGDEHASIVHAADDFLTCEVATPSSSPRFTWKGSRQKGFAVRRVFKSGHVMVHVFQSLRDFVQRESKHEAPKVKLCERMFVMLDTKSILQDPCCGLDATTNPLISMETLQQRMKTMDVNSQLIVVDDIGKPRYYAVGNKPRSVGDGPQYTYCRTCATLVYPEQDVVEDTNTANLKWFGALQSTTHVSEYCELAPAKVLNCAFVLSHDGRDAQLRSSSVSQLSLHQHTNAVMQSSAPTFRYAYVGAMHNPRLQYVNTYKEMSSILMERALGISVAYGCKLNMNLRNGITHFEAEMPRNPCKCCTSDGANALYCKMRIAALLLLIDLYEPIESITTTIEELQGHTLQSTPFQVPCGLRCAHDWTNGSGDVYFRGTFAKPASFDTYVFDAAVLFGDGEHEQQQQHVPPGNVLVVDQQYRSVDAIEHGSRLLVLKQL